jgi:tripartite-type tricarboxylate transporter receptor subunit TctC
MKRFALALLALACIPAAHAQPEAWPSRPIKILVPYTPGTGQDTIARAVAPGLTARLGQPIVVENRPGASGNIGMEAVAKAPPDGYTLLMTASTVVLNPLLYKNLGWDPFRDLAPVANITTGYLALVTNTKVPANNVKEFIALLKARPGKLSYSSTGIGTPQHLSGELFKTATQTFMLHVPYRGSAGAITGLVGGEVEAMFMPAHSALPLASQGRLRLLAIVGDRRAPVAPDVPTIKEAGGPAIDASVWYPMYAPARTPADIVNRISAAVADILRQPDVAENLNKQGLTIAYKNPQELLAHMKSESARWGAVVKEKNLVGE